MPDESFKEFVLDQLGALPELRAAKRSAVCPKPQRVARRLSSLLIDSIRT
jgi:hypothetical protein